jgi:hypothetical protein
VDGQAFDIGRAGILHPAIAMMDQAVWLGFALRDRYGKRLDG